MNRFIYLSLFIAFFTACSSSSMEEAPTESYSEKSSSPAEGFEDDLSNDAPQGNHLSSSAAEVSNIPGKKFIRTADIKYRVKNVRSSTNKLEDITRKNGGYVTYTNLQSDINRTENTPISADSSLETMYYTINNTITLRVPNSTLNNTLREMSSEIDYLDYRTITANDISISYLSNELEQRRIEKHNKRLEQVIDDQGKKIKQTINAEENLYEKETRKDHSKIANLTLQDKVEYSTVSLYIYQRQGVKREIVENYKNIEAYQPDYLSQAGEAITSGWNGIKNISIGLITIWPFLLFITALFFIIRKYKHHLKSKK